MKYKAKRHVAVLTLCAGAVLAGASGIQTAAAQRAGGGGGLPDHYPAGLEREGRLSSVDHARRLVVIEDGHFWMDQDLHVRTPASVNAGPHALRRGARVAYDFESRDGREYLTDVWVLPPGVRLRHAVQE